ncbi:AraC family transcriptional regulator [Vibrio sp. SCSIO 43132]|uniref:GlxA family transcriptional regulator n=1 Tax=Vibrio sp. SCSIO 43132 TaxID=2779363 RepID=UPI001CAA3EE8|nr:helix-turn-helix domain-containing protein [Vibrio sp. SCSIO 43132]UAB73606.1 AraC family transcriptional regulator [Vibrio sp. SCSIO 43132]
MKTLNIYILTFPEVMPSAVQGVKDLFQIANQQFGSKQFDVRELAYQSSEPVDGNALIFIPPCLSADLPDFQTEAVITLIREWHRAGAVIVSSCASVFWLANAGLLDGKYATTHWRLCDQLERDYPSISKVCTHEMLVDEGDIVTAAGLYAFQDLALHVMARYANFELAKQVADFCLLDFKGRMQAYYQRFIPDLTHGDVVVLKAQQFCDANFSQDLAVADIAQHCHLSERSLLRRFKSATGYTPKQYIIQLRVERAKQLIELENITIEAAGAAVGYTDVSNFTKLFKKTTGITPAEFKQRVG